MKKIIYILFLGIGLVSCSSDDSTAQISETPEIEYPNIIGKWNLVAVCGGISSGCNYPSGNYTETVEFKDDLAYIETYNDSIQLESTYSVTDTIVAGNSVYFKIEFGFDFTTEFSFISDTLSIVRGDYWDNYTRINE